MSKVRVPHDALIFVGDGRRALFLRNAGNPAAPSFHTEHVFAQNNPPTDEQGADRPAARSQASAARVPPSNRPTGTTSRKSASRMTSPTSSR